MARSVRIGRAHDDAALRSALSAAADQGSPRFLARWGGEGNPQLVEVQQRSGEPTSNVAMEVDDASQSATALT